MFDFPSETPKTCFAHHSDRDLHAGIRQYCSLWLSSALLRTDAALDTARQTNHCVVQLDTMGNVLGVSLPIQQQYFSTAVSWVVSSPVELLFHHHDQEECAGFLTKTILPKQAVLLREKYEDALMYTVVRKAHGHAAILADHGWKAFDPEFELVLSREQTGAKCQRDDLWFKAPR